jgi:hypothetical protein
MTRVIGTGAQAVFVGSVDDTDALLAAASIALACREYVRDDDDECYVEGDAPTCFNCRGRRWVRGGFSCTRGLLNNR